MSVGRFASWYHVTVPKTSQLSSKSFIKTSTPTTESYASVYDSSATRNTPCVAHITYVQPLGENNRT